MTETFYSMHPYLCSGYKRLTSQSLPFTVGTVGVHPIFYLNAHMLAVFHS